MYHSRKSDLLGKWRGMPDVQVDNAKMDNSAMIVDLSVVRPSKIDDEIPVRWKKSECGMRFILQ